MAWFSICTATLGSCSIFVPSLAGRVGWNNPDGSAVVRGVPPVQALQSPLGDALPQTGRLPPLLGARIRTTADLRASPRRSSCALDRRPDSREIQVLQHVSRQRSRVPVPHSTGDLRPEPDESGGRIPSRRPVPSLQPAQHV